jgi:hypothetical protein
MKNHELNPKNIYEELALHRFNLTWEWLEKNVEIYEKMLYNVYDLIKKRFS